MNNPYLSKTLQWPPDQLKMIEEGSAQELVVALIGAGPVVALRAIAEVMLNEDEDKLKLLLADTAFTAYWRDYESDYELDERDDQYAQQLEEKLIEMNK